MSILLISLPVYMVLLFLVGLMAWTYWIKENLNVANVPQLRQERPDLTALKEGLSRIFPSESGEVVAFKGKAKNTKEVRIQLKGVVIGAINRALVVIDGKETLISEGQEVKGVKLVKLWRRGAKFSINGKERVVYIRSGDSKTSAGKPNLPPPPPPPGDVRLSRKDILRVTKDPGIMFREIRLVPYVRNGRTEGFIFEWIKSGSLFDKVGLKRGDILVSINNMNIKSGEDAFRILQTLRNSPNLKVVVLRGGVRKELNIRID